MAALVNAGMNRRVPENAQICRNEDKFASHEGHCSVALVRLVSLVSYLFWLVRLVSLVS
jgi:hypothetical protein